MLLQPNVYCRDRAGDSCDMQDVLDSHVNCLRSCCQVSNISKERMRGGSSTIIEITCTP